MPREMPIAMPGWTRPIRIPERIEITHADPPFAIAGETSSWRVPFKLAKDVSIGSELRFQAWGGRNNKGSFSGAQIDNPEAEGYLAAELENGARVPMQAGEYAGAYVLALPDNGLQKGQILTIVLGDRAKGGAGIKACKEHVFNKFFVLYSVPAKDAEVRLPPRPDRGGWTKGTEDLIVAACTMHILGGRIEHIRVYVPSTTKPGQVFNVMVRPEDEFGNLSHEVMGAISISLNEEMLVAEIERVSGSTSVRAKVSLPAEGVYRIKVREAGSDRQAMTNPIVCSDKVEPVYWGMIHGHTEISDGTGSIDHYFHQLKNEVMLDFAASGDHDHLGETPEEFWKTTCEAVKRWHDPGQFVTFLGYEWAKWRRNGDGDRNVYYLDDDRSLYRSDNGNYPSPPELFNILRERKERAIVIPHHTAHGGNFCDWKDHSPEYERLVEIFQFRGSYECSERDGNPVPERAAGRSPYPGGYVRNALALGWRVGFTAGGDDHAGQWGTEFRFDMGKTNYKQGLMSVQAGQRTREAIFQAMYNRRVVATTGARILLSYDVGGKPMGCELNVRNNPELISSRMLSVEFHGTAPAERLDIIRNNTVVHSMPGNGRIDMTIAWEDTEPIEKTWLPPAKFSEHPFTFYYVRALQTDGEVAWASPVWIDP